MVLQYSSIHSKRDKRAKEFFVQSITSFPRHSRNVRFLPVFNYKAFLEASLWKNFTYQANLHSSQIKNSINLTHCRLIFFFHQQTLNKQKITLTYKLHDYVICENLQSISLRSSPTPQSSRGLRKAAAEQHRCESVHP